MTKPVAKKPRRLLNPKADEVSLVDRGANQIDFLLVKRDTENEGSMTLAELCAHATEAFASIREVLSARVSEIRQKRATPEGKDKAVSFAEVLKDDENESMADLLEAVEGVMGTSTIAYPFRRVPVVEKAEEPEAAEGMGMCPKCKEKTKLCKECGMCEKDCSCKEKSKEPKKDEKPVETVKSETPPAPAPAAPQPEVKTESPRYATLEEVERIVVGAVESVLSARKK